LATFSGPRRLMMPGPSKFGAPGEIRTPGLLVRSQALYPTELRAQGARILPQRLPISIPAAHAGGSSGRCTKSFTYVSRALGYGASAHLWRRGRDSNPRRAFDPYALSRGAPSTTRPPLRISLKRQFAERGIIPVRSSLGKARERTAFFRRHQSSWRVPHPHCRHDLVRA
jgi:hypothetical protein